jgi:hypothetical protein
MISSLKSGFDTSPGRTVFLSTEKLAVYHWDRGALDTSYLFNVSPDGQRYFERYLKETPKMTTYFLIDLLEEEYRQETIPHVFGMDRNAMIERKKSRLFRDTPFSYADIQGREEEGRRDDRVLFMALTNPDILAPWLNLLDANKIPLAGIYSLPQLTKSMLDKLPEPSDHMLIISLQSISGLRQTFFYKRQFRISRLVGMPPYGTESCVPYINGETKVLRRYLDSMRLLSAENPLDIYYLANRQLLEELEKIRTNTTMQRHHYIDINSISQAAGLRKVITTPFSDQFFIYLLMKQKPANIYAQKSETRYYLMQKTRQIMNAASVLIVLSGFLLGGVNFTIGVIYREQALVVKKKAEFYSAQYEVALGKLPLATLGTRDLREVVSIANALRKYKVEPIDMLKTISRVLEDFPLIYIDEISWSASADPGIKPADAEANPLYRGNPGASNPQQAATGNSYYHTALVNGHIGSFEGNYREALNIIEEFAEDLRALDHVYDVAVMNLPLGISSNTSLQGGSNTNAEQSGFSIKIVMGIHHEP